MYSVMEAASSATRGALVAEPGRKFVVADLSAIEGRVIAWLAGETWKLKAFADYDAGKAPDIYRATGGRMLGKKPEDLTKEERQSVGKTSELACGFEGGVGAFITFATAFGIDLDELAEKARPALHPNTLGEARAVLDWTKKKRRTTYGLSDETWIVIEAIKRTWRKSHPAICQFWKDLDEAARAAIDTAGREFPAGKVRFIRNGAWLRCILPSGRSLCYPSPKITEKGEISYMGVHQFSRQWTRIKTYGGKLAENCTQAVARDILAHGLMAAEAAGYNPVLHVHDEIITEPPDEPEFTREGLSKLMSTNPAWADGLPLAASGFTATRYRKDG